MEKPEFIQMLIAIRAQTEAMHASLSAALSLLLGETEAESDGPCRHPPDKRVNTTTNGGPDKFFCQVCHQEFESSP